MLHQVIAEHLEVFLRAVAEAGDGAGLPQFVEREFREFLTCGVFEHGMARFRCEGCAREHLVPFSCKGRAWCRIGSGARQTPSCWRHEVAFVLIRPVHRSIDGGGLSGLACRSLAPVRSTREEAADVHCGSGFWGGQRPSLAPYVTGMGPMDGVTAAGGRSCCLSSRWN